MQSAKCCIGVWLVWLSDCQYMLSDNWQLVTTQQSGWMVQKYSIKMRRGGVRLKLFTFSGPTWSFHVFNIEIATCLLLIICFASPLVSHLSPARILHQGSIIRASPPAHLLTLKKQSILHRSRWGTVLQFYVSSMTRRQIMSCPGWLLQAN